VASDEISVGPPPSLAKNARNIADAGVRGACVGRPLHGIDVRIIEIVDAPIASIDDARELPRGEIGEIIVRGAVVTKVYDAAAEATAAAKIPDTADSAGPGRVWHRMGDCGYFDADGRIWFCGRKVERVETPDLRLFTEPCERVFRRHPQVVRCAMIGIGQSELRQQEPALVVEADLPDEAGARKFAGELRALALTNSATRTINRFYFRKKFPVDVRHNAKIHRLTLARWAERIPPVIVRSDEV
jgi:acyl-CoA synthetase (AMP-forming)/AMP-acid ligase II